MTRTKSVLNRDDAAVNRPSEAPTTPTTGDGDHHHHHDGDDGGKRAAMTVGALAYEPATTTLARARAALAPAAGRQGNELHWPQDRGRGPITTPKISKLPIPKAVLSKDKKPTRFRKKPVVVEHFPGGGQET